MAKFWGNKIQERKMNGRLEEELRRLSKPELSEQKRLWLRNTVLNSVRADDADEKALLPSSLQNLADSMVKVSRAVKLQAQVSAMLKEQILNFISASTILHKSEVRRASARIYFSGALLAVFVMAVFVSFPFKAQVAKASTYLSDVHGEVLVLRESKIVEGHDDFQLEEGDILMTNMNSFATVFFFDDSQSRLSENTNLTVNRLYTEPLNSLVTKTELFLKSGRIWTKVINLVDGDATFIIETDKAQVSVSGKAAFDLQVENESTKLRVFDNVVEFTPVYDKPKVVVAGYKAEVASSKSGVINLEVLDESDKWVALNLLKDDEYDEEVSDQKEELFENEHESDKLVASYLENPEIEEQKERFMHAFHALIIAESSLVRGNRQGAINNLKRFKAVTLNVIAMLPQFYEDDPINAKLLRSLIEEKVYMQLKDLAAFIPGDKLYRAKEILQEVQIALAGSNVEKTEVLLTQARGKLLEIEELLENDKPGLSDVLLKRYQVLTDNFVLTITKETEEELLANLVPLFNQQIEQLKVLAAIEQSLGDQQDQYFRNKVATVRQENLTKLVTALEQLPASFPRELILELKDIFDTYFAETTDDSEMLNQVFDKLLFNEYQVSFIQPDEDLIPEEIGIVMIVMGEGSAEVKSEVTEVIEDLDPTLEESED